MMDHAPLHLSVVGRLVIDHSPSGQGETMVACLVAPNHVVTDGAPFRGFETHPEALVTTLWLPQDPGGLRRSWPATLVRYDPESDVAVLRFPGDESSSPGTRPILADALPPTSVRCELRLPDDRSNPDSPSSVDTVVALVLDDAGMIKADGRERLHLRATAAPPQLLAGAPVFWNDSVIGIISRAGQEPGDLYAIPATAIRRVMQNLTAPAPTLPDGFFSSLSESSHRALDHANAMRDAMHQDKVHMEHLLLALYEKDNGPTERELRRTGISEEELRRRLSAIAEADLPAFGSYPVTPLTTLPPVSPHVQRALIAAQQSAVASGSEQVQSRHLLFGALSVRECRAVSWMFERAPAVDPAQIDMTAQPSKRSDSAAAAKGTAEADNAAVPAATDRGQQRARVAPDLPDGDDLLDVRREVRAICAVIAARDTSPPLSIGLFGDWGTGKSFFMNRMEERITRLKETARSNPTSAYCPNIVQLRFNAWHYMDTDLWASLAAEIFEGLARALQEDKGLLEGVGGDSNVARSRLLAATSHLRDVRAQAERQKAEADVALRDSQQRLTDLASEESAIVARLSPKALVKAAYRFVAGHERTAQSIDSAAKQLGIPEGKALATDTRATLLELKGLWGGVRAVLLSLRSGSAPLWIALVIIFVVVLLAIAMLAKYSEGLPKLTAAAMLLGSAIGFVKRIIGPAREALATVEAARAESQTLIDGERTRRETELKRAHRAIQERSNAEESAITRVTQEIAQLEAQLEALRADRQMVDFVRAKQESTDYTKHFGVIARARNDFQQLTDLLRRVASEGQDGAAAPGNTDTRPPVPRIDRIILYIDDLDRCPEAKVVDVLQAVHLLLAFPLFVVVVGVDSRWLLHSLRQHATVFRSNEDEDDGMDAEERVHWQSTPFNYLEKIFQIPFNLQPMEKGGFIALIDDLTIPKKRAPDVHGGPPVAAGQAAAVVIPEGATSTIVERLVTSTMAATQRLRDAGSVPAAPAPGGAIQQVPAPPAGPVVPAAGTAPTQTGAPPATPEPPSDPVEPNPPFLDLTEMERTFMHRMHRLIPTPRAAKRYVNVYRLLRASLSDSKRAVLEDDIQGGCRSVLLMLAILTGFPQEGTVILRELVEREPDGSWWKFIEQLARENMEPDRVFHADDSGRDKRSSKPAARRSGATKTTADAASLTGERSSADRKDDARRSIEQRQRAQRWAELSERMVKVRADVTTELGEDPQCESFSRWARQVARYSFEAGRVVGVGDSDAAHERRPQTKVTSERGREGPRG